MIENKKGRIFICPNNDLEAKIIIELLEKNEEEYIVTSQAWGASWEMLEPEIKEKIEIAKNTGIEICGIELKGYAEECTNIDHHIYQDATYDTGVPVIDAKTGKQSVNWQGILLFEDDRSNNKSSIEQVADILGVELTIDEQFVAANDKGYIPAMEKLGAELGISEGNLRQIIANIRMRDRQMQGITLEQEEQAQEAVEKLGDLSKKSDYISMSLPHSKTSTVTDRLYGKYDNLLITSADGETNFYGKTEIIEMLNEKFPGGWSGGQLEQGSGFWGGYADQEAIKAEVQSIIDRNRAEEIGNTEGIGKDD